MAAGAQSAVTRAGDPLDERVRRRTASLDAMFNPGSVVIIADGSTPDSAAETMLSTVSKSGFAGRLFAVGLDEAASGMAVRSYRSVQELPPDIDLAVVTVPAGRLLPVLGECAAVGVKAAMVTAPPDDKDVLGTEAHSRTQLSLRGSGLRVLGPNCSVLMNPSLGLNASLGAPPAVGGTVALISQSNALCRGLLDWSFRGIVGFSAFLATGGMIDVDWGDLIDHFGADPSTRSIVLFMESIGNPRSFLSAAREVALNKPIIVVKVGRSDAAMRIIDEHTNLPPGSDEVLDAALRRVGVLRVSTVAELFSMADVLSKQPRPSGPRLGIVSNAGGLSALAADSLGDVGAQMAPLSEQSREQLGQLLPSRCRTENPIHVATDAPAESYVEASRILLQDPNCDGLLLLTAAEGMSHGEHAAELLAGMENPSRKPILACIMGMGNGTDSQQVMSRACIPVFSNPQLAARAFGYMWRYAYNLRGIYETPMRRGDPVEQLRREMAAGIVATARASARKELADSECRYLLGNYGIRLLETRSASTEDDAVREAGELGYPVVLQVAAAEASGTVQSFNLVDSDSLRRAWLFLQERVGTAGFAATLRSYVATDDYVLRIASRIDPQFGPVVIFGAGGRLADAINDCAFGLPPLNATLAERMVKRTRIYRALAGRAGRSDMAAVLNLIVRFSQLVIEQPWINEVDINPVVPSREGCVGISARVAVHDSGVAEQQLPKPAIRPYPVQYMSSWQTKRGDGVMIRPIQAEDEALMIKFHQALSDRSVYLRYFQNIALRQRTQHDRLTRICFIDYDREMALVAEHRDAQTEERRIVGLGDLARVRGRNEGEVAAIVSDDYQGHGLGTELMRRLVNVARAEKMERVVASTMLENGATVTMLKRVGFQVKVNFEDHVVEGEINL